MKLATGLVRPCTILQGSSHCSSTTSHSQKFSANLRISNSWTPKGSHNSGNSLASKASKLRDKWAEFQGIKNWEGLLDPLDDNLRKEILRYGEFVDAAYRCFDFDTSSPGYATCLYPRNSMLDQCGFCSTGYKVTKSLHATCGVQLPQLCTERLPNWMSTRSSWIGYVAVCNDEKELARLGRRDVVVAYRGTATSMEWLENLRATLTCLPCDMAPDNCESMVQTGFLSLYTSSTGSHQSLKEIVTDEIGKILRKYADEPLSITVTGHSLGAALATLTAHDITTTFKHAPLVTVVSFGGPRVGNRNFRCQIEKNGTKILRIVNSEDPITKVPGFVFEDNNEVPRNGDVQIAGGFSNWLQKRMEDTQWVYAEIGNELRLSSKDCPQINDRNIATCHDLKTYLHLVDNFVSSNCPLRAKARSVLSNLHVC
ncbi:phospholipase A(1) DAD1, chloroplastic-like [Olea europaea var. sylvestris]|uniref:Phospholipase A(1) DAD1, chloroplastic-like n=1 Tax=Olea europaea subsp. europaea TaxID=158383 RepID=A0A8S0US01_OLEEU|nr:phospholipase A(1) DAD1, chloroplastic-like [Olea europaea var. sylvestris]CAA3020595.1 phospholipase A(1) DAD1, chloroplastic-like [Olea europaea subsp. europaea]